MPAAGQPSGPRRLRARLQRWWPLLAAAVVVAALAVLAYAPQPGESDLVPRPVPAPSADAAVVPADVLLFCSDVWPPYAGRAEASREGYVVDLLRNVLGTEGYDVRYVNLPWSACIQDVRSGRITGLAGMEPADAPDLVFPAESVGRVTSVFFVRRGDRWRYEGTASLAGRRLGVIQNYTYEPALDEYVRTHSGTDRILAATGDRGLERLLMALESGGIDCAIEDETVLRHTLTSLGRSPESVQLAGALRSNELRIGLSPRSPRVREIAAVIDSGLRRLRGQGQLTPLLAPYGVQDWKAR
jgi:polar amino acid transport system substrate-binding protein